tara:strand:+ start:387 stop:755 length:369 start_codon:yes stop_codon:yes gene_type:complete
MAFTPEKQAEIDRMNNERQEDLSEPKGNDEDGNALPTALERLEVRSVAELKCRVNVLSVSADSVTYAPENNYSSVDQGVINAVLPQSKWMMAIPVLLDDAQVLRDGGMAEASILAMLRQTNR